MLNFINFFGIIIEIIEDLLTKKSKIMNNRKIFEFRKTDHFLFRQWERGFDDCLLKKIIPHINNVICKKKVVIVDKAFLIKKGIKCKAARLIIVIKDKCLATIYWMETKGSEKLKINEIKNRNFVQFLK
jgi:hypothetical protein